jgi:hypothetical protein
VGPHPAEHRVSEKNFVIWEFGELVILLRAAYRPRIESAQLPNL